jgi:hypothetical protein
MNKNLRNGLVGAGILAAGLLIIDGQTTGKIPVKVSDTYQDGTFENTPELLFDGKTDAAYVSAWNHINFPHDLVIDLTDYKATIKTIRIYDGQGSGWNTKLLLVNEAGDTTNVGTYTGDKYNQWVEFTTDVRASAFIMRTMKGGAVYGNELELIGDYTPYTEPAYTRVKKPLKDLMGVNAHPWDIDSNIYPAKYKALVDLELTGIRLYSDSYADKDSSGNWAMNPELRGFKIDSNLFRLKRDGFVTHLCYQNQSLQVKKTWDAAGKTSHLNFSYQYNFLRENPASHIEMGRDMFVLAGRGGSNANVPDYPVYVSKNWWDPKNLMIKGGGFYDVIEPMNEANAWWRGYDGFMNGKQLGPAHSMWYDGHKGQFQNAGAKTADPNILLSANGLASDKPDIYRSIHAWSKKHRGYKNGVVDLPFDIIQFHCYSSIGGQYSGSAGGLPPETGMMPQVKNMVHFSNKYTGGLPVWIGEWGWDVHRNSPLNAPAYGKYTAEQTRGNWAIRALLSFAEAGVDRAEWYRLYQEWPNRIYDSVAQQFATMALLRQQDDKATVITRTLVGDYFKQFRFFGDFVFDGRVNDHVLKFKNGTKILYAMWTVENMAVVDKRPSFTEVNATWNVNTAGTMFTLSDNGSGVLTSQAFAGGSITFGSKPVFILVDGTEPAPDPVDTITKPDPLPDTPTYTGRKGYWVLEGKRVYYAVYKSSTGVYSIKTGNYTWYKGI